MSYSSSSYRASGQRPRHDLRSNETFSLSEDPLISDNSDAMHGSLDISSAAPSQSSDHIPEDMAAVYNTIGDSSFSGLPEIPQPDIQLPLLLDTALECSQRGLILGAQWLFELANSLRCDSSHYTPRAYADGLSNSEAPIFFLSKTYFDTHEFKRCAHALRNCTSQPALFLRLYALYLAGESKKEEKHPNVLEYAVSQTKNCNLETIRVHIQQRISRQLPCDAFLHYLLGIVLRDQGHTANARKHLVNAVKKEPLLWSAWVALASLCKDKTDFNTLSVELPDHWIKHHYHAHAAIELHLEAEALELFNTLEHIYPDSSTIAVNLGRVHHNLRDVGMAEQYFSHVSNIDPYRLDYVDSYSNILYMQEDVTELSRLAHHVVSIDKYRPETCCVIGNYYSRREFSKKAEIYFRRAIKLDRNCLSAWTLLGHEYIELRNAHAAVAALRRAIDINCRDYRGWSNLGYAYDLLCMPTYSLYYYKRALRLRPYDPRIWDALASVFQALKQPYRAIKCLENILSFNDNDVSISHRIAKIYCSEVSPPILDKAALYYLKTISLDDTGNVIISDENIVEACEFLMTYFMRRNDPEKVEKYANALISYGGKPKQSAKRLLRQLHERQVEQRNGNEESPLQTPNFHGITRSSFPSITALLQDTEEFLIVDNSVMQRDDLNFHPRRQPRDEESDHNNDDNAGEYDDMELNVSSED